MDTYQVTDEGSGLVRVDAQIRLVRKPIAVAMCDEVDRVVAGYDGFRILMNMSAMSKGTPAAGFFVLRTMKKYPLEKLALFGANGFMRGMAKIVLGLARFDTFELFDDEAEARRWLDRAGSEPAADPGGGGPASPGGDAASGGPRPSRRRRDRAPRAALHISYRNGQRRRPLLTIGPSRGPHGLEGKVARSSRGRVVGRFRSRSRRGWRAVLGVVPALAFLVLVTPAATASPGTLDVSFGVGGALRTNFGGTYDWAYATALQPDGRILAAGVSDAHGTYDFAVARYTATQQLDPTFGNHGVVLTDFGHSYDWAFALALQPDGKIVVAGVSDVSGSKDFALARYNPDGTLDRSFGQAGLVTLSIRALTADIIHGIAIQPDGKIVAAGVTFEDVFTLRPHG